MKIPTPERAKTAGDEPVLPLINIVFLLLIFFMLAGVVAPRPPFALDLPSTRANRHSARLADRVLAVDADGRLAFAGERLSRAQLGRALADWPERQPVQVRADGRLPSGDLDALLTTLRQAGIAEISLLTRHRRQ